MDDDDVTDSGLFDGRCAVRKGGGGHDIESAQDDLNTGRHSYQYYYYYYAISSKKSRSQDSLRHIGRSAARHRALGSGQQMSASDDETFM